MRRASSEARERTSTLDPSTPAPLAPTMFSISSVGAKGEVVGPEDVDGGGGEVVGLEDGDEGGGEGEGCRMFWTESAKLCELTTWYTSMEKPVVESKNPLPS